MTGVAQPHHDLHAPLPVAAAPTRRVGERAASVTDTVATTVADVMVRRPKTMPVTTTVGEALTAFAGGHVHMLLVTDGATVVGTVVAGDLPKGDNDPREELSPVLRYASLSGRTVHVGASAAAVERTMVAHGLRRLAVVDTAGTLLGLMCLKRRGRGFCSDADVASRAHDH